MFAFETEACDESSYIGLPPDKELTHLSQHSSSNFSPDWEQDINFATKPNPVIEDYRPASAPPYCEFLRHANHEWLMRPLIPQQFDLELLELLLTSFQRHVSNVMISFTGPLVSQHTLPMQIIAMAAFGALFTGLPESYHVAKWLFAESQRMLKFYLTPAQKLTHGQTGSVVKTLVTLELFGYFSGHERSNENSEAYHQALLHTLSEYQDGCVSCLLSNCHQNFPSSPAAIACDLQILEAYRVVICALQPIWCPKSASSLQILSEGFLDSVSSMISDSTTPVWLYHQLTLIISFSYQTKRYQSGLDCTNSAPNWRPETVEYSMLNFVSRYGPELQAKPSASILLRTCLWVIRTPIDAFHRAAFQVLQKKTVLSDRLSSTLRRWRRSPSRGIVLNHVKTVIIHAEELTKNDSNHTEAPHDALCVYLGVLALCFTYSNLRADDPYVDSEGSRWIRRGMGCIEGLRASVTTKMMPILQKLHDSLLC